MCSACITISPAAVEQRRGGVTALLDVGRVGRADQHRAHLLADRAQRAGQHLELNRIDHRSRSRQTLPASSTCPLQLGGISSVDSGSSTIAGPANEVPGPGAPPHHLEVDLRAAEDRGSPASARRLALALGHHRHVAGGQGSGDPDRHQLERPVGIAVAVALLVGGLEGGAQRGGIRRQPSLDRELERLSPVAQLVGGAPASGPRRHPAPVAPRRRGRRRSPASARR